MTCMPGPQELLLEIANCSVAGDLRRNPTRPHPCQRIVSSQGGTVFQLPEPWVGQIDRAPILFIGANPSLDQDERFPNSDKSEWADHRVIDFFSNRFTSSERWVEKYKVSLRNGKYSKTSVRFWLAVRQRASKILDKAAAEVEPGVDFALTEVVHCKSRLEEGVREASCFCRKRYLKRILEIAAAKVIIVYGSVARAAVESAFPRESVATLSERITGPHTLFGISRIIAFLPKPNAWHGGMAFEESELSAIRIHLSG